MNRGESILKNSIIFAIGNIGSKFIQFVLLPYYTYVLSETEYGTIDVVQSIGTLLIPLLSLTIAEAVFRFAMDKKESPQEIFSIGVLTVFAGALLGA